jgi:hypothetical protein
VTLDINGIVQKLIDGILTGVGVIIAVALVRKFMPGVI